ncbi:MAG: SDR family NAD(P)-dependent oxidoreductase, partial [Nocardioidaceae bacterium]
EELIEEHPMKLDLAGRTAVITGGAGGLGRATAHELVKRGARVGLLDLSAESAAAAAAELGEKKVAASWRVDVRDLASVEEAMAAAAEHFGGIDVVVAGAGIGNVVAALDATRPEDFERVIDINLTGAWRTFRAGAPYVIKERGHLLAIASMASFLHSPLHGSYTASKAGVWAMCNSLRLELRQSGVTVGSVHPAFFRTPMIDEVLEDAVARKVWNDFKGVFEVLSIDDVVPAIVRGIERRSQQIVIPKKLRMASIAPGAMRPLVERMGYPDQNIREAIDLSRSER